jgi:hypothetical protein
MIKTTTVGKAFMVLFAPGRMVPPRQRVGLGPDAHGVLLLKM